MHCAKGDFPRAQYAVYLHAIDARRSVKCGIDAVTCCDVTANHSSDILVHKIILVLVFILFSSQNFYFI